MRCSMLRQTRAGGCTGAMPSFSGVSRSCHAATRRRRAGILLQRALEAATRAALQCAECELGSQGFTQIIVGILHVRITWSRLDRSALQTASQFLQTAPDPGLYSAQRLSHVHCQLGV